MKSSAQVEKRRFWRGHIAMAGRYAGSHKAYCRSQGISVHSFYYWKKRLLGDGAKSVALVPRPFVPVEVTPPRIGMSSRLPDPRWLAEFILHLNGVRS